MNRYTEGSLQKLFPLELDDRPLFAKDMGNGSSKMAQTMKAIGQTTPLMDLEPSNMLMGRATKGNSLKEWWWDKESSLFRTGQFKRAYLKIIDIWNEEIIIDITN